MSADDINDDDGDDGDDGDDNTVAGVGGALFLVTIILLGVVSQIYHWRKTKTKAK